MIRTLTSLGRGGHLRVRGLAACERARDLSTVTKSWTKRDALLGGAVSLLSLSSAAAQLQNPPLVRVPQQPALTPPTSVVLRSDQIELLLRTLGQAYTHGF